ncbi:uncharacterized protein BO97DRAFT_175414 [Aspergillus homomorphus CBS 101889]|uniref:Uncharacterized protein n=1 Tax=Aspergillus homomorphus (strain CBS 101889) TaxID=1450537 RepID=A0A395I7K7_ASPHC|nr:hypothetical protein BO97DRAFT_175414 [Aspergillus homomorphus CBS 101889]RAL15789.1 hypothetical protein BO97DRAFT_175414 [Aspergillus homomorphus CBS 101889]
MYRYFGIYFLQPSFIFLILAQKLGQKSDNLILRNCAINLQVLDKFVLATNMDFQRTLNPSMEIHYQDMIELAIPIYRHFRSYRLISTPKCYVIAGLRASWDCGHTQSHRH